MNLVNKNINYLLQICTTYPLLVRSSSRLLKENRLLLRLPLDLKISVTDKRSSSERKKKRILQLIFKESEYYVSVKQEQNQIYTSSYKNEFKIQLQNHIYNVQARW